MILFGLFYRKVSSKYHKCDRSIMKSASKHHKIAKMHHKTAIKVSQNCYKVSCIKSKPPNRMNCPEIVLTYTDIDRHIYG